MHPELQVLASFMNRGRARSNWRRISAPIVEKQTAGVGPGDDLQVEVVEEDSVLATRASPTGDYCPGRFETRRNPGE